MASPAQSDIESALFVSMILAWIVVAKRRDNHLVNLVHVTAQPPGFSYLSASHDASSSTLL